MKWYNKLKEEVFLLLESSPKGLTEEEAQTRIEKYGLNQIREEESISKIQILMAQIKNPIIYIILITAIITFIFGKYTDTIVIGIVVVFNTLIGFAQEYKAEANLNALKSMVNQKCTVLRQSEQGNDYNQIHIDARYIVSGDIILLESGDKITADARVIEAINLEVDESMLTGESLPIKKNSNKLEEELNVADRKNMVYAGTVVTKGRGRAIIVETAMNTEIGKIPI